MIGLMAGTESNLTVVPANRATWADLQTVLGTRGPASVCQCQRYKLGYREAFATNPVAVRADRLRQQTDCDHPRSDTTSGLVAYLGDEPVGWCAVEPRPAFTGLVRNNRVPWEGRTEDKTDNTVWAVTCLFARAGYRRRGISRALARGAVDFAREHGARALEGYPIVSTDVITEELHVGTVSVFTDAGLIEIGRPTLRRAVMQIAF